MFTGELDARPGIREQPKPNSDNLSAIDGLAREREFAASVQFLRQDASIDVCVSWRWDLRFAAETHHRAFQ